MDQTDEHRQPRVRDDALQRPGGRLAARLVSTQRRAAVNTALAAGRVRRVASVELLAEEHLTSLARWSLALLAVGAVVFGVLELAALVAHSPHHAVTISIGVGQVALLVVGNLLLYGVMMVAHEAIHALVILILGGRPRFGLKLPLALYCTSPGYVFTPSGYVAVALAPLVVLSLFGALATWISPALGAYLFFALVGNVAGAVGDLVAAVGMRSLPRDAFVRDTATGYEAYVIEAP